VDAAVHERHMRRAIEIAHGNPGDPFGCVIADGETGEVLAEGLNDAAKNPILHGEIDAILNLAGTDPDVEWTWLILSTTRALPHVLRGDPVVRHTPRDLRLLDSYPKAPGSSADKPVL
jgi:pyrimidine deaminase RibD-like protein